MRTVVGSPESLGVECEVQKPVDPNREDFKRKDGRDETCLFTIMSRLSHSDVLILHVLLLQKQMKHQKERAHSFRGWLGVNGFKSEQTGSRREHSLTLRLKFVLKAEVLSICSLPSCLAGLKIAKVTAMLNLRL